MFIPQAQLQQLSEALKRHESQIRQQTDQMTKLINRAVEQNPNWPLPALSKLTPDIEKFGAMTIRFQETVKRHADQLVIPGAAFSTVFARGGLMEASTALDILSTNPRARFIPEGGMPLSELVGLAHKAQASAEESNQQ